MAATKSAAADLGQRWICGVLIGRWQWNFLADAMGLTRLPFGDKRDRGTV